MSLLDVNINTLHGNRTNNITLPPISAIIKSIDSTLPPLPHSQPPSRTTSTSSSSDTLITNNNNIPTLLPIDSYTNYTYSQQRSNSSDSSLSTSPSLQQQQQHLHLQQQQQQQQHIPIPNHELEQSQPQQQHSTTTTSSSIKRKYTCKTCDKSFTTSGHLARHSRIHTGERKHVCPFPNCQSRFARQDNCMQHYKTHLNNKLRKRKYTKKV